MTSPTTIQFATVANVQALVDAAFINANTSYNELKPITYYGGVAGTNITTALQTALDNDFKVSFPPAALPWYADQALIKGHDRHIHLSVGAELKKVSTSGVGWGNSFITNGGAAASIKANNFRLTGGGKITTDAAASGGMVSIYGDDQLYQDFTIDGYRDGIAIYPAGDRIRGTRFKILNPGTFYNPNTGLVDYGGQGGFRFAAGSDCVVYGAHVISGDDCYQAVPTQAAHAHPWANQSIDGVIYMAVTGRSMAARFFAAVLSDTTVGAPGMTASVRNVILHGFHGFGGSRGIAIRNDFGSAGSTGEIRGIIVSHGTLDQIYATAAHNEEITVARDPGTGTVRGVVFDEVSVTNPKGRTLSVNGDVESPKFHGGFWPAHAAANYVMDLSEANNPEVVGVEFDGAGTAGVILCGGGASVTKRPIIKGNLFRNIPAVAMSVVNLNNAPRAQTTDNIFRGGNAAAAVRAVRYGTASLNGVTEDNDVSELLSNSKFSVLADTRKRYNIGDNEADSVEPGLALLAPKVDLISVKVNTTGGAYTLPNGFPRHKITLTATTTALTLPQMEPGTTTVLYLVQNTANRMATLVAPAGYSIVPIGYVPALSTVAGKVDRLVVDCYEANVLVIEPVVYAILG